MSINPYSIDLPKRSEKLQLIRDQAQRKLGDLPNRRCGTTVGKCVQLENMDEAVEIVVEKCYMCSPSAFYNVAKEFSIEQKDAISSIGLGSLLHIHGKIHLRRHIIDFVVEHYSPNSGAVMVDNTTVPISLTDMVLCFGLPVVGSRIVLEGNDDSIRELRDLYEVKGGYIYKGTLEKMLKAGDSGETFQRTFILFALCTLFVPHAKQYVSEKYLYALVEMKTVKKIAWGEFSYSTLVEAICRVKHGKVANVGGFVVFLQYWYMEHVGPIQEGEKKLLRQQIPRFLSWTEEMFNLREKYLMEPKELVLYLHPTVKEKQLREVKRLLKRLPKDGAENSVKEIVPCHVSTNVDEKTLGDEHPLLVSSEGLPNLASGVRDEHLHHNDMTELLSKALEQISDLQRIVGEQAAWRVEVEKELTRRELHDTQMSFVIEDLRQKIATQDTIIETLREQLAKKENSTQNEFNKRSLQDSIYVSESPLKRSAVHPLISDSKEMNKLGSTVAKRVAINSRVKSRPHKTECYKSYAEELPTHQRMKLRKVISTLARDPTRPSLFPSLTASQKAAVDDAQRCDGIRSMRRGICLQSCFKTLEPGGLLDDMVIDAYMRILDNQQREWGPPHQKRTYYGSSHLHQFMRKCVMERKFSSGVPVHTNSAGFDIYESDRVFIPVNRSGVHWYLVEVDLLRRKVTILDSMRPRRTEKIALEIRTLLAGLEYVFEGKQLEGGHSYNFRDWDCEYEKSVPQQQNSTDCGIFMIGYIEYWNGQPNSISFSEGDIEAYRDKIAVSLLLSPLNRKEEDSSSRCFAWNGGSGAKVQWRKT
ncbi:hypothetical protein HHK36_013758 [Tetracentron sinense]|uniref:Ubiquitin-like protease family profile domain-containing protein n=1 Tax=Tetracentron sinense TaxID=13715 RepID=A0A834Z4Q5_TETSI|nr:hypothetical protein HHK36_013758 [Tetracentron sinense]